MKQSWIVTAVVLVLAQAACRDANPDIDVDSRDVSAVRVLPYDTAFSRLSQNGGFSGSVLVAVPDKVFEQSYEMAGAPAEMSVKSSHQYPIGEIAHVLLRATYFRLAEQGKLDLNAPLGNYVPSLPSSDLSGDRPLNEVLNFRMLLDHRGGLPAQLPGSGSLADLTLRSQPGTQEHYSALGYDLLAVALSDRLSKPIATIIEEVTLITLQMESTGAFDPTEAFSNRAIGYSDASGQLREVALAELPTPQLPGGLPEYYSTVTDLFYLAQRLPATAYLQGKLIQPAVRPGYRSFFYAAQDGSKVAVVLSNFGGADLGEMQRIVGL